MIYEVRGSLAVEVGKGRKAKGDDPGEAPRVEVQRQLWVVSAVGAEEAIEKAKRGRAGLVVEHVQACPEVSGVIP